MKLKKNPEADINTKKNSLLLMGLMTSLAMVLVSFQWKTFEHTSMSLAEFNDDFLEEEYVAPVQLIKPVVPLRTKSLAPQILLLDDESDEPETLDAYIPDPDDFFPDMDIPEPIEPEDPIKPYDFVDMMPVFPDGDLARINFLKSEIKYPQMAIDVNITGKVYVKFSVEPDGSIDNVHVIKGIGGGCDEEAIRVVKSFPKWTPGIHMGSAVPVWIVIPIDFKLK